MSREEFIQAHCHELYGMLLEAARLRLPTGELGLWADGMMMRIKSLLGQYHHELTKSQPAPLPSPATPPAPANGPPRPAPPRKATP